MIRPPGQVRLAAGDEAIGPGLTTDGEAEDKVKQIVTASEREVAEAAHCDWQPIRRQFWRRTAEAENNI